VNLHAPRAKSTELTARSVARECLANSLSAISSWQNWKREHWLGRSVRVGQARPDIAAARAAPASLSLARTWLARTAHNLPHAGMPEQMRVYRRRLAHRPVFGGTQGQYRTSARSEASFTMSQAWPR